MVQFVGQKTVTASVARQEIHLPIREPATYQCI
jgi:hypothetical protein